MADIFLSYSKEDRKIAGRIAAALSEEGWDVFWDRTIPAGKTWRNWIGGKLDDAKCMVVLWSETSVESRWVLEEAEIGVQRDMLIPAAIASVAPPLGFGAIQAADLSNWTGTHDAPEFQELLRAVEELAGKPGPAETSPEASEPPVETARLQTTPEPQETIADISPQPVRNTTPPTTAQAIPSGKAPTWLWLLLLTGLAGYATFTALLYNSVPTDRLSSYYFGAVLAVLVAGSLVAAGRASRMYWACMAGAVAQIAALILAILNALGDIGLLASVFGGLAVVMAILGQLFRKFSKQT